jgi:hypothetical protein
MYGCLTHLVAIWRRSASKIDSFGRRCRLAVEHLESRSLLTASWTPLVNPAPIAGGTMDLLPNGSVLMTDESYNGNTSNEWAILTPAANGSYTSGTWTRASNANQTHLYDATQVLPNGQVFVAGGEFGTGGQTGELYNPLTNTWMLMPSQPYGGISDAPSMLLPNGTVLIAPDSPSQNGYTTIFNPAAPSNPWSQGPKLFRGTDAAEQGWVKLPDGSVLTIDGNTTSNGVTTSTSERYIPSLNQWVNDGAVPVQIYDSLGEIGPGLLLNDGRAIFFGGTGHTAIYTPSGSSSPGTWAAGPDIPGGNGCDDNPGVMLRDGTVLLATGPVGTYDGTTTFYIYDPNNSQTPFSLAANQPANTIRHDLDRMLALPDGNALVFVYGDGLMEFDPGTSVSTTAAADAPTITNIALNANGSLLLTGTGLNGINAGAAYGDDAQMDSNYPIVRLVNGSNVYYARAYNWSNTGVMLGSTSETVDFTLPLGIPPGSYSVYAVANGIASSPASLMVSTTPGNAAPTVATPAAASSSTVTGTTVNLSVLGSDDSGASNLTYTWATVTSPSGIQLPSFSDNGDNTAHNVTATFHQTGTYTFTATITDAGGLSTTSSVMVNVNQTPSLTVTPATVSIASRSQYQFSASEVDQFGTVVNANPAVIWSAANGSIASTGLYTAPSSGTSDTVTAQLGSLMATSSITISQPIGWWKLNEGSGAVATDIGQAPADNGAISGGAWGQSSSVTDERNALQLNGTSTVVALGTPAKLQITGQITLSAWIKPSNITTTNSQFIINSGQNVANYTFLDTVNGFYEVGSYNGTFHLTGASIASSDLNTWVLLTGTYDGTTWRLYRDGVQISSFVDSAGAFTAGGKWEIGAAAFGSGSSSFGYFAGEISNARVYNTAIDPGGIAALAAQPPTIATAANATHNPVTGTTTALSVLGADDYGESTLTYTWSTTGTLPAAVMFSVNGTNAAKNTTATFAATGTYNFLVTITNVAGFSTTSTLVVAVNPSYSGMSISPGTPNLTGGATQQFMATALDQFNMPLASQPAITWSLVSGPGLLTNAGLYTPPYAGGSAVVQASSGAYSGSANITFSSEAKWNAASDSSWTTGSNWIDTFTAGSLAAPGVRGLTGDTVLFASTPIARLDGATPTLAAVTFNNAASGYGIIQGSGGSLTLQGGLAGSGATVSVLAGNPVINAQVHLASNTTFGAAASTTLTIMGPVDGSGSLTMTGSGKLYLNGVNSFGGGLFVQTGTVVVSTATGLADGSNLTIGSASAFAGPVVASAAAAPIAGPSQASAPASLTAKSLAPRAVAAVMAASPRLSTAGTGASVLSGADASAAALSYSTARWYSPLRPPIRPLLATLRS